MAVKDYSTNPDENTTISGINIAEGCPPSGINNAIRQLMADVKTDHDAQESTNTELAKVMTGATASAAGTSGNVPAPAAGKQDKPLNGAGQWADFIDCMVTSIKSSDGTAIDAAKLLDMLSKFLPISGGTLTGHLTVPSTLHVLPEGVEGGQIQLDKGSASSENAVIDLLGDHIRFFGSTTAKELAKVNIKTGEFEGKFSGGLTQVFVEKRGAGTGVQVPAGGTWVVFAISDHGGTDGRVNEASTVAGGTFINWSYGGYGFLAVGIRIA